MRALADRLDRPADILAGLQQRMDGVAFDAVIFELDTASGAARQAMHGQAQVRQAGSDSEFGKAALDENGILWITAGPVRALAGGHLADEGLVSLVRPAMHASDGGAGIAVILKSLARKKRSVTLAIANDLEAIPSLLNDIYRFLHQQGIAEEAVHGLDVALDEVLTNIVNYGYRDGKSHEVLVELSLAPDLLTIEVRDDGSHYDPLSVPEPDLSADIEDRHVGGLGMHFVRSLLDRLAYKRSNGWNVLTLEKRLSQGA
jgi:anti-sigma regulatory factor (Ser/Thr protein kinase)